MASWNGLLRWVGIAGLLGACGAGEEPCGRNERVAEGDCVPCPIGTANEAGDDATGPDTGCQDPCTLALGTSCEWFAEPFFKASNTDPGDEFGFSVAFDGGFLAVGAPAESSPAVGVDGATTGVNGDPSSNDADASGAVYVFRRSGRTWQQEAYLKASNTDEGDRFGYSVALDGSVLAVGAQGEDSAAMGVNGDQSSNAAADSGAVYVFERSGATWRQAAYLKASNSDEDESFGFSMAIDGDTLAVGAPGEDSSATGVNGDQSDADALGSGAVYVFTRSEATWQQAAYLKASNTGLGDEFGSSVALHGDTLAVGALSEDSTATGVDGDSGDDDAPGSGAVYLFTRSETTWQQTAYLKASNTDENDLFGTSVALFGDTLAVGAFGEDSAATGVDGDQGNSLMLSTGAVYLFRRSDGTWQQEAYLKASNTGAADGFGFSVAINGERLAVGAPFESSAATGVNGSQSNDDARESGAVYVFAHSDGTWRQEAYLKAFNTGEDDLFGYSVALDDSALVVGATREDSALTGVGGDSSNDEAPESGAAYIFGAYEPS